MTAHPLNKAIGTVPPRIFAPHHHSKGMEVKSKALKSHQASPLAQDLLRWLLGKAPT